MNEVGSLPAVLALPFVEPISNYQASSSSERMSKRRLIGDRLGSGIDHPVADYRVIRPGRYQAPNQEGAGLQGIRSLYDEFFRGYGAEIGLAYPEFLLNLTYKQTYMLCGGY